MSKLSKQIAARQTGHYQYVHMSSPINIDYSIEPPSVDVGNYQYEKIRLDVTFGSQILLQVKAPPEGKKREERAALLQIRRAVIEEVFGEFRKPIHTLWFHLRNYDFKQACEQLEQIEKEMFDV